MKKKTFTSITAIMVLIIISISGPLIVGKNLEEKTIIESSDKFNEVMDCGCGGQSDDSQEELTICDILRKMCNDCWDNYINNEPNNWENCNPLCMDQCDADNDGVISDDELQCYMSCMEDCYTPTDCQAICITAEIICLILDLADRQLEE